MKKRISRSALFLSSGMGFLAFGPARAQHIVIDTDHEYLCEEEPWIMVFSEDFRGDHLDDSRWVTYFPYTDDGSDQCLRCRVPEDGNCIYRDENVSVANGSLRIEARYEPGSWFGESKSYTSGMIRSRGPWEFSLGKFEARMRLPASEGQAHGLWPAFWLHGGYQYGNILKGQTEIDVMELCGDEQYVWKGTTHNTFDFYPFDNDDEELFHHYSTYDHGSGFPDGTFHTYAVEWDKYFLYFYVDGVGRGSMPRLITPFWQENVWDCYPEGTEFWARNSFPNPDAVLNIIANLAIAGPNSVFCENNGSNMNPAVFPKLMEVDYIRAWKRSDQMDGFSAICNVPRKVMGDLGFCALNEEHEYTVSGTHGTLNWSVGNGLQIVSVSADGDHCVVRNVSLQPGQRSNVNATCNDGPCVANESYGASVTAGPPVWDPDNGTLPQTHCAEYATIDIPRVYGSGGDYDVYVDGVLQTDTYVPDYVTDLPGGGHVYGYDWWGNPVTTPWSPGNYFFYFTGQGVTDWCHDYYYRASNNCGTSTSPVYHVRDHCRFGPCDFHEIDGVKNLEVMTVVYPNPTDGVFNVTVDETVDLGLIRNIVVRDWNLKTIAEVQAPTEHRMQMNARDWPSGIYYVTFELIEDASFNKNLIR